MDNIHLRWEVPGRLLLPVYVFSALYKHIKYLGALFSHGSKALATVDILHVNNKLRFVKIE